jgi:hypothetical protein
MIAPLPGDEEGQARLSSQDEPGQSFVPGPRIRPPGHGFCKKAADIGVAVRDRRRVSDAEDDPTKGDQR